MNPDLDFFFIVVTCYSNNWVMVRLKVNDALLYGSAKGHNFCYFLHALPVSLYLSRKLLHFRSKNCQEYIDLSRRLGR